MQPQQSALEHRLCLEAIVCVCVSRIGTHHIRISILCQLEVEGEMVLKKNNIPLSSTVTSLSHASI